jgi:hypothetical protein
MMLAKLRTDESWTLVPEDPPEIDRRSRHFPACVTTIGQEENLKKTFVFSEIFHIDC